MAKKQRANGRKEQNEMARTVDELIEFEKFRSDILPKLKALVEKGATAEEIYSFGQSMAAAKAITIALREEDSGKAMSAIKDILDRTQGKAKERQEVEHKFGKMREEELDALLLARLKDADADASEEDSKH